MNAPALLALLTGSKLAEMGFTDTTAVLASLDRTIHGSPADLAGLHALIAIEVWLANCPSFDDWWEPTAARETNR